MKLVAVKLRKYASLWWENLKRTRVRERRSRIKTWVKMKKELKRKFLPTDYKQNTYLDLHNLKQKEMTVEEYTTAFDHAMIKCDVSEADEHPIARYLGGLRPEIGNMWICILTGPMVTLSNLL